MAALRPTQRLLSRCISLTPRISTSTYSITSSTYSITSTTTIKSSAHLCTAARSKLSFQSSRALSTSHCLRDQDQKRSPSEPGPDEKLDSGIPPSKIYNYEDIRSFSESPSSNRIIIDVREPSEILGTGKIPGAQNVPIGSAADSFFLPAEEFEDRFGFARPGDKDEVVFYCKAGVRSKAAARLAGQAGFGGKVGEFPGSWVEWFERGGKVERVD